MSYKLLMIGLWILIIALSLCLFVGVPMSMEYHDRKMEEIYEANHRHTVSKWKRFLSSEAKRVLRDGNTNTELNTYWNPVTIELYKTEDGLICEARYTGYDWKFWTDDDIVVIEKAASREEAIRAWAKER